MGIIYLIKNKIDGKCYVGQTKRDIKKRWIEHQRNDDGCVALNNAMIKHGNNNFELSILEENINDDKLNESEIKYIAQLNTLCPNGYNIQTGGQLGKSHCEESRERMRQAKLGNKNPNFGKPRSEITKQRISNSKKGEKHHFYGKHLSAEHKLHLSKAHKKTDLPIYMVYVKPRPEQYQGEGYVIANHPKGKNKMFTSKKLSLEEKYKLANEYLTMLNSL